MKKIISTVLILATTPAESHCFKYWRYPWPQLCRYRALPPSNERVLAEPAKNWYIEITRLPRLDK